MVSKVITSICITVLRQRDSCEFVILSGELLASKQANQWGLGPTKTTCSAWTLLLLHLLRTVLVHKLLGDYYTLHLPLKWVSRHNLVLSIYMDNPSSP